MDKVSKGMLTVAGFLFLGFFVVSEETIIETVNVCDTRKVFDPETNETVVETFCQLVNYTTAVQNYTTLPEQELFEKVRFLHEQNIILVQNVSALCAANPGVC